MWTSRCVFAFFLMAGIEPLSAQVMHPKLAANEINLASFAVTPPIVEASSPKLEEKEVKSRAEKLSSELASLIEEELGARNWEVKGALRAENIAGEEATLALDAVQKDYDSLEKKMRSKPKEVSKGLYTLGETIHKLDNIVAPDAFIFVRAIASFYDAVKSSSSGTSFTITFTSKSEVSAFISVVHAKTGAVLYCFGAEGKGVYNESLQNIRKYVVAALDKLTAPVLSASAISSQSKPESGPSDEEKLIAWKGEKVTILGTHPLSCKADDMDGGPRIFRRLGSDRNEKELPLNRYAGRNGTIIDAKIVSYRPEITIQLDDGEKIVSSDERALGFHSEIEAARKLIGTALWTKRSQTLIRPENICSDDLSIQSKKRLSLKKLERVDVASAEFGIYRQQLHLTIQTEYGRKGILDDWDGSDYLDSRFHLEQSMGRGIKHYSERFYFADPWKK